MFSDNDWYGHKKVLLKYCKIKKKIPIYGTLQHGYYVNYKINERFKPSKIFRNAPYFSWNNFLSKNKKINSIPIGSPFIYLHLLNKKKIKENGTLVFPSHSNPEYPQKVDHVNLIKFVKKNFTKPYKVSLFYTDFLDLKIKRLYKKNNFKILCSGHRGNNLFLENVYKNISGSKYIFFTEFGSPTLYSMFLKKKIAIYEDDKKNNFYSYVGKDIQYFRKKNEYFFNKKLYSKSNIEKNFEFSKKELGFKFIRKRKELISLLNLENNFYLIISKIVKFFYDIKYGKEIRGVKLNKNFKRKKIYTTDYHFKKACDYHLKKVK